jgi:hypothetical protein
LSLKSEIGIKSGPYQDQITLDRIHSFRKAIGAQLDLVAPPTFLTLFRRGEFDLFKVLGVELSRVLHAEQEYDYQHPILAGDQVHFETTLTQVLEKNGTSYRMQFLTFETDVQSQRDSTRVPVGKAKTMIVIREKV